MLASPRVLVAPLQGILLQMQIRDTERMKARRKLEEKAWQRAVEGGLETREEQRKILGEASLYRESIETV